MGSGWFVILKDVISRPLNCVEQNLAVPKFWLEVLGEMMDVVGEGVIHPPITFDY